MNFAVKLTMVRSLSNFSILSFGQREVKVLSSLQTLETSCSLWENWLQYDILCISSSIHASEPIYNVEISLYYGVWFHAYHDIITVSLYDNLLVRGFIQLHNLSQKENFNINTIRTPHMVIHASRMDSSSPKLWYIAYAKYARYPHTNIPTKIHLAYFPTLTFRWWIWLCSSRIRLDPVLLEVVECVSTSGVSSSLSTESLYWFWSKVI